MTVEYFDEVRRDLVAAGFADAADLSDEQIAIALLHYMREKGVTLEGVRRHAHCDNEGSKEEHVETLITEIERIVSRHTGNRVY